MVDMFAVFDDYILREIAEKFLPEHNRERDCEHEYIRSLANLSQTCKYMHAIAQPLISYFFDKVARSDERKVIIKNDATSGPAHLIKALGKCSFLFGLIMVSDCEIYFNASREVHSYSDKPAIILNKTHRHWFKNGQLHRGGDKPAMVFPQSRFWLCCGKMHREKDKPALICSNGSFSWYIDDYLIRVEGRPCV